MDKIIFLVEKCFPLSLEDTDQYNRADVQPEAELMDVHEQERLQGSEYLPTRTWANIIDFEHNLVEIFT